MRKRIPITTAGIFLKGLCRNFSIKIKRKNSIEEEAYFSAVILGTISRPSLFKPHFGKQFLFLSPGDEPRLGMLSQKTRCFIGEISSLHFQRHACQYIIDITTT